MCGSDHLQAQYGKDTLKALAREADETFKRLEAELGKVKPGATATAPPTRTGLHAEVGAINDVACKDLLS
jgi:hypothetical protein